MLSPQEWAKVAPRGLLTIDRGELLGPAVNYLGCSNQATPIHPSGLTVSGLIRARSKQEGFV